MAAKCFIACYTFSSIVKPLYVLTVLGWFLMEITNSMGLEYFYECLYTMTFFISRVTKLLCDDIIRRAGDSLLFSIGKNGAQYVAGWLFIPILSLLVFFGIVLGSMPSFQSLWIFIFRSSVHICFPQFRRSFIDNLLLLTLKPAIGSISYCREFPLWRIGSFASFLFSVNEVYESLNGPLQMSPISPRDEVLSLIVTGLFSLIGAFLMVKYLGRFRSLISGNKEDNVNVTLVLGL